MNTDTLFANDGVTLLPPPKAVLQNHGTMAEYIDSVFRELADDREEFEAHHFEWLQQTFEIAFGTTEQILSDSDIRAILSLNIQFVSLYKDQLGRRMPSMDASFPYAVMSQFIDFLLFVCELHSPAYNLLSRPRRRLDIKMGSYFNVDETPNPTIATESYRRHLLEDDEFQEQMRILPDYINATRWAFCMDRFECRDWAVIFKKRGKNTPLRTNALSDKASRILRDFCFTHNLSMIGTFFSADTDDFGLHFLPQQIWVNRTDFGIRLEIPEFYTFNQLRNHLTTEMTDLEYFMKKDNYELSKTGPIDPKHKRKIVQFVAKALRKAAVPPNIADDCLAVVSNAMDWSKPHQVISEDRQKELRYLDSGYSEYELFQIAHLAVREHVHDIGRVRLWNEVMRIASREQIYDPFDRIS